MSTLKSSSASKTAGESLVITRILDAPVELVWRAWTEPEHVKKWWGPKAFTCPICEIDFRVGGRYFSCMRTDEGPEIWKKGIYGIGIFKEIVPFKKIVVTDSFADEKGNVVPASFYGMEGNFPLEMLITVSFETHEGNKTRMTMTHKGLPAGEHQAGANQGWSESFDKLAASLIELSTERN